MAPIQAVVACVQSAAPPSSRVPVDARVGGRTNGRCRRGDNGCCCAGMKEATTKILWRGSHSIRLPKDPSQFQIRRQSDVARASPWIRQPVPLGGEGGWPPKDTTLFGAPGTCAAGVRCVHVWRAMGAVQEESPGEAAWLRKDSFSRRVPFSS